VQLPKPDKKLPKGANLSVTGRIRQGILSLEDALFGFNHWRETVWILGW
jgi:hypothetical protein